MAEKKFFVDVNLQGNNINNLKADTLDITTNLASANTKRIVYWSGQYYYSDGTSWNIFTALGYTPANRAGDTFTGAISATNLSGTNTGDQDLSGLVIKNTSITGATKTKITYDAKGLVTAGADATTADIADSSNKRYVTDAHLVIIGNTSNTNTGDNAVNTLYSGLDASKQDVITLTTTDSFGAATLVGNTLNIPIYESSLIPKNSGNEIWRGVTYRNNSTTADTTSGLTISTSGTNTARAVATTSYATRNIRMGVTASIVATGRYSGLRGSSLLWYVTGGFLYTGEFNISDTATAAGTHNFWGLASSTSDLLIGSISNDQPSALTNIIAFANDSGDANLQIMYNNASGTATKTDLSASFPSNRTAGAAITTIYSCYLYNAPASSNVIYRIVNKETGAVAQGTLSTNLPASTVGLNFFGVRTMGTSGGGITNSGQFDVYRLGVYSL